MKEYVMNSKKIRVAVSLVAILGLIQFSCIQNVKAYAAEKQNVLETSLTTNGRNLLLEYK